jgi:N-methylhydantoinase A
MTVGYRIGADIGGTFTDIVLVADDGQTFELGKVLTTPAAPEKAILAGVKELLERENTDARDVRHVVHGTTLFTNALIERRGSKTALITTKGFRDALEIAREHRYDMYDLHMEKAPPLAPRHLRFELDERVLADGTIRKPLDENEVKQLAAQLKKEGVEAVAVCFIHSYLRPEHERAVGKILRELLPEISITISSDLVPEIREYDRTSTTVANVYVKKISERYLAALRRGLEDGVGIKGPLFVMQSNGGVCEVETAKENPIRLVESGPAAGAIAAAHFGKIFGILDLLSFDMGGTTAKACVIADGEPLITPEFEVDRRYHFRKGSGLPVKVPVIEMIEIGTGGGSIASVDAMRRLQVGPRSAGSSPGPSCYGLGGKEPCVTDADLMLGYLDPNFFLGGKMKLDVDAASEAISRVVGKPLDLPTVKAAWGMHKLANESMASAARIHAIERGKDVAKFPLFAFGGAGPVHAFGVAQILRSPKIIFPLAAGVMSAVGFLAAPLCLDSVRSLPGLLEELDWQAVMRAIGEMEDEGRETLSRTIPAKQTRFRRWADMRYRKQGYEIRVPIPDGPLDESSTVEIRAAFEAAYIKIYGQNLHGGAVEVVSWRVQSLGPTPELKLPKANPTSKAKDGIKNHRDIFIPGADGFVSTPVYDRYALVPGQKVAGPAIFEERESTVVINGAAEIAVDDRCNLFVIPVKGSV